ncbi:DEAD/DEAH box helicase [Archaeoglobus neptunius]|uniref:DEAD/DEAH box helicase n=1 Tax=Archaeoglobus neptunius TaxID=2798580 RepID=UPI001929569F
MKVEELSEYISSYAVKILKEEGIEELFPPQAEVVDRVFSDKNLLLAMPTASGKTLLAELAMVREAIKGGKCIYVVPLRALASEKYDSFKKWKKIGLRIGISVGDYESRDEHLADCDIIITTSEKADSLIRNRAGWIKNISCLVLDEIHLLDSEKRGATLEILVTKMRRMNRKLRIIGLSATAPNVDEIAEWLDAEYYASDWRPVPLTEGILCGDELELVSDGVTRKSFEDLVEECVVEGGGVLVFESTRRGAESTAVKLSKITGKYVKNDRIAKPILEENEGEMSRKLADCCRKGAAFHHAGLLSSQRKIVEEAFRKGDLRVVVATPTLAAGVNLPARRVIIRSIYRFDGYSKRIKVSEYKQMAGRAGRPGMDEYGEAIVCVNRRDRDLVRERYIFGEPERITSKLGVETHLRFHSLSIICDGYARTVDELEEFFSDTFFFKQNEISLAYELERVVRQLENWGMIEEDGYLVPTKLGLLVSRLYIDPMTGFIFHDVLSRMELDDTGALHLICRTPDMERLNIRKTDSWVEEEAFRLRKNLTYYPSEFSVEYDWFLSEVKTALCLKDWIEEMDEDEICSKYSIAPGDLRRIIETAEWLSNAMNRIAEEIGNNCVRGLTERIKHGVREELLDLVEIKYIGRVRARKLYNAGIRNAEEIMKNSSRVASLIGRGVAEKVLKALSL